MAQATQAQGARLADQSFIVLAMGIGSAAMAVPAIHAVSGGDVATAQAFGFSMLVGLALTLLIGLATQNYGTRGAARGQLIGLMGSFAVLPLLFAMPVQASVGEMGFFHAWFEMVSSFTTTGATLLGEPGAARPSVHLWRAIVGWLGGLLIWIAAISVFAPLNIGGFEVRAAARGEEPLRGAMANPLRVARSERLVRFGAKLLPVYGGLTAVLWIGLIFAGESPLVAACHAMSVLATSGISPTGGLVGAGAGFAGELIIFVFLGFGLSRLTFSRGLLSDDDRPLRRDPEIRMAIAVITVISALIFSRHLFGAMGAGKAFDPQGVFSALWGAVFSVMSFLTTTGFETVHWDRASIWSGLGTPGLILLGVALIGGGVATTAGGVKLLRVYALFRHSEREIERLIHPNSVGGAGAQARRIRRQGAFIAWVFLMLLILSFAAIMLLLALTGVGFEEALILGIAALTTTGPLAEVAAAAPISYAATPDLAKAVLAFAMVLGRLETLALIALFNTEFWRR